MNKFFDFDIPTFDKIPPEPVIIPTIFFQPAEFPGEKDCSITVCVGIDSGITYVLDMQYS